jgi:hypothetical protein
MRNKGGQPGGIRHIVCVHVIKRDLTGDPEGDAINKRIEALQRIRCTTGARLALLTQKCPSAQFGSWKILADNEEDSIGSAPAEKWCGATE